MKTIKEVQEYIELLDINLIRRTLSLTSAIETISKEIEKIKDNQAKSLLVKARAGYIDEYRKSRGS